MVQALGRYPNNNSVLFDDYSGANLDPIEEINHFIVQRYPNNNSVLFDDYSGANLDPIEEINHFIVHHANAPRGNRFANAPRLGCAMDAVFGIANIQGAGTQGVFRAASHESRNDMPPSGFPFDHDLWRVPIGPDRLASDFILPRPGKAFTAHAHRIHDGPVVWQNIVEAPFRCADQYGTRVHGFKKIDNPVAGFIGFLRRDQARGLTTSHAAIDLEHGRIELQLSRIDRRNYQRATGD
jgi:hypothetical protein